VDRLLRQGRPAPIGQDGLTKEEITMALSEEYECGQWTKWRQGSSPKEHREMLDRQWLIAREDRRDDEARKWQFVVALAAALVAAGAALGGVALQANLQKEPVVNNVIVLPTAPAATPQAAQVSTPVTMPP